MSGRQQIGLGLLALLVLLLVIWRARTKEAKASAAAAAASLAQAQAAVAHEAAVHATLNTVNSIAMNAWGSNLTPAKELIPADQAKYPGFYLTADGGYVNPDTGEAYSPGSTPRVYPPLPPPTLYLDVPSDAENQAIADAGTGSLTDDDMQHLGQGDESTLKTAEYGSTGQSIWDAWQAAEAAGQPTSDILAAAGQAQAAQHLKDSQEVIY